ncbi:hypothetical protein NUACC21_12260 [Scytonema sp. NUACC21]
MEQVPVQIAPNVPLTPLPELHAHKHGFLSGVGEHVSEQTTDIGKLLPSISGHFADDVALTVYHLIVGQRQHIVFTVVVPHTKGDVIGTTAIRDAAELRVKESDRIAVMAHQLNKMGAKVTELPDGMEITGGTPLSGAEVDSYTDHRIAMSLAIAALNASGTTHIQRAEAAAVSYPEFVTTLQQVCGG